MPCKVQGAIYADDLVLWCSDVRLITANYRLQQAPNILEGRTNRWLVKISTRKTTCTVFSLSAKEQKANLHLNGQTLLAKDIQNYLEGGRGGLGGFRQAADMKTAKWESRSQSQGAACPMLAGTTWGVYTVNLWRLYTGRVRLVLEYGMTVWGIIWHDMTCHDSIQPGSTLIDSAKYRSRQPASSQGPWSQRRQRSLL